MNNTIKEVLEKIIEKDYEAYVVGGYIRDYLLGVESFDVDICTNAKPAILQEIFIDNNGTNNYGGFKLNINNYNIDITTFRIEKNYVDRRPEVIYIDSLEKDIKRRDFTINAICMDVNGKIIDLVNGINDINNRVIKMIDEDISAKLTEDPLRILRGVRLACVLNFEIEENLYKEILNNHSLVKTLSKERIKEELDKILSSKNFMIGLKFLKELHILEDLEISYDEVVYVSDLNGMYAQLIMNNSFPFTKKEITNIINIESILKEGNINNHILYKYGLNTLLVAGEILGIDKDTINNLYNSMPIKNDNDLDISNEEIIEVLNTNIINDKKRDLINHILDNKIKNKKEEIKKYLKESM